MITPRTILIDTIRQTLTRAVYEQLRLLDVETLTDYVLGTGAHSLIAEDWRKIARATAEFTANIYSHAAELR